ncbi:MAG: acyclic terpene utilization AtuA family protein [Candidatus Hodarchaeota archaeon]
MDELRILQSSAMGYGNVSWESIHRGLELGPHLIVGQGTSSDPGPAYLGSTELHTYVGRRNRKRDIGLILRAAVEAKIPFIFSGGSPDGSDFHLAGILEVVNELCHENGWKFKIAVISGQIEKGWLKKTLRDGAKTWRLANYRGLSQQISSEEVDECFIIVAQMGPEPIVNALREGVDGVITGRAVDLALHTAYPLFRGFDKAVSAHMAKTIECGALCAEPAIADNMFAILKRDHFIVFPLAPSRRCSVASVASHSFYERPDILKELNPGGYLDVSQASYEQIDERSVKVRGARWVDQPYTVKLEGVKSIGYRTITLAGIRDPVLIENIDTFLEAVRRRTESNWRQEAKNFQLEFAIFGKDAVLGPSEPNSRITGHECCVLASVVAETQELATAICAFLRGSLFFLDYPGRTSTAGNVAIPFSPGDIEMGKAYVWKIWHAIELDDPVEPFKGKIIGFPCDPSYFSWLTGGKIVEGGKVRG